MSFLKNIWKQSSKHQKLCEEWTKSNSEINSELFNKNDLNEEQDDDTFQLKYLGNHLVKGESNEKATTEAIKIILKNKKAKNEKLNQVTVNVSSYGIKIKDELNGKENEISIYRISYCSAVASHNKIFAFIAANNNDELECHAFVCRKSKIAQNVTLSVARAFNMAYENWKHGGSTYNIKEKTINIPERPENSLIKIEDTTQDNNSISRSPTNNKINWISFDDESEASKDKNAQYISYS